MKYLALALASAALTGAQTPAISIRPNSAASALVGARTGVPILGYIAGPGSLELRPIVGTVKGAQLGANVSVPVATKRFFVPPREHYLLLESIANESLSVWSPAKGSVAGTSAMTHPDVVAFSARGEAAAVYAKTADRLQVISGLPAEPKVATLPGFGKLDEVVSFAVSDDGGAVVALMADGTALSFAGAGGWQRLPNAFGAHAMLFVPNTHNLVISDPSQRLVTLLPDFGSSRILAQGIQADRLAFTKEGDVLLAASSTQGKLWTVDLKTLMPATVSFSTIDTLLPLRDGRTFLLSSPGLSLLTLPVDADGAAAFITVTR